MVNMKARTVRAAGLAALGVLTLSALGTLGVFAAGCKAALPAVRIGGIFPLSGNAAVFGTETMNGVLLAVAEINSSGGVNGRRIELVCEDDAGTPELTAAAFDKLTTEDGASIVIGSVTSGCAMAIAAMAQERGVVLLAPSATAEALTAAGGYVFRACFTDRFHGTAAAAFAARSLGARTAAVLYNGASYPSSALKDSFSASFQKEGGTIAAASAYSPDASDFGAQTALVKNSGADIVYIPDHYNTAALIAKRLRAEGVNAAIMGADGWDGAAAGAGDEAVGAFYTRQHAPDSTEPRAVEFAAAYGAKYGESPDYYAALGYDSVLLLRDAIILAGSAEAFAVRDALAAVNGSYVTGKFAFDARRNPVKSAAVIEIVKKDGRLAAVYRATVDPR